MHVLSEATNSGMPQQHATGVTMQLCAAIAVPTVRHCLAGGGLEDKVFAAMESYIRPIKARRLLFLVPA